MDEYENGSSLDIKTNYAVKLREPGLFIRGIYKARLKVAKKIIRKEKEKAKKENKEEEFKNKVQQIINIMNVCGNLVLVQDEKEILRLITCGDIGLAEELFENIKKENSQYSKDSVKQILTNLFSVQNIVIYIISFMISMVGFRNQSLVLSISPFAISFLAAMLSSRMPIGIGYILTLLGTFISFGTNSLLTYF